jgi:hypothetical protein
VGRRQLGVGVGTGRPEGVSRAAMFDYAIHDFLFLQSLTLSRPRSEVCAEPWRLAPEDSRSPASNILQTSDCFRGSAGAPRGDPARPTFVL